VDATAEPETHAAANDAPETPSAVKATGLGLHFDDRRILQQIDLDVPPGQAVALMGANGAGKSTLLQVLATLIHPSQGRLELFGETIGPRSGGIRRRIGIIAHQSILYRDLSIRENLEFFGKLYDVVAAAERTREMLEMVGLAPRADDAVKTLSRGMTQRVSIARALMHDPDLLLADEPFNGLDAASTKALEALLRRIGQAGKAVIMANHDIAQSLALADRAVVLRQGRVVVDRPAGEIAVEDVLCEMSAR